MDNRSDKPQPLNLAFLDPKGISALQVELAVSNSETAARMVKAKIEKTVLGQVASHIKAVLQPTAGFVSICLDLEAINRLQLIITPRSVALALLKHTKLKVKADMIRYHPFGSLMLPQPCVNAMPEDAGNRADMTGTALWVLLCSSSPVALCTHGICQDMVKTMEPATRQQKQATSFGSAA